MKKINTLIVSAVCALALVGSTFAADTVATAKTAPVQTVQADNSWVFTLGGASSTATGPTTSTTIGFDASLGHTGVLILPLEAGIRQSVAFNDESANEGAVLNSRAYADWTLVSYKVIDLFAGVAVGAQYGEGLKPVWEAAPEAGVRLWIKEDVAVLARAEVPWNIDGMVFQDKVRCFLGVQVKF